MAPMELPHRLYCVRRGGTETFDRFQPELRVPPDRLLYHPEPVFGGDWEGALLVGVDLDGDEPDFVEAPFVADGGGEVEVSFVDRIEGSAEESHLFLLCHGHLD